MKKKEKEQRRGYKYHEVLRKPPNEKKFEELSDAVSDGKALFVKGDILVMRRDHRPDKQVGICSVLSMFDDGDVILYDESHGQRFIFNLSDLNDPNPPTLKFVEKGRAIEAYLSSSMGGKDLAELTASFQESIENPETLITLDESEINDV